MHFLRRLARVTLVSYAQVLLSSRALSGLFFCAASFVSVPQVGLVGLSAALAANLTGFWTCRERVRWELGLAGYNAVMLGLAIGYFLPFRWWVIPLGAAAGAVSAAATNLLQRPLARFSLPVLGLPFLVLSWLVLGLAGGFRVNAAKTVLNLLHLPATGLLAVFLRDMGSVYFSTSFLSGVLVLTGLLFTSRISAGISLLGALAGVALNAWHPISVSASINLVIAPIGLAFFLAPNRWLPLHLLGGLALTVLVTIGLEPLFRAVNTPMLILPLTITIFVALLMGRYRVLGVELVPLRLLHTPEFNLRVFRSRLRSNLQLPFFGTWFVSQGVDGGLTHKGRLGRAWDFMVRDERGRTFATPGYRLTDYHAFGLLVCAPAAGRVVALENNVPDNLPGKLNEKQNWGNWLVIEHSLLEYSILAHLQQGSIRVRIGDRVQPGAVLAACGNSGYSGQPHLHYQLQTDSPPGSDTLSARFGNYLVMGGAGGGGQGSGDGERFVHQGVPNEGETILPLPVQSDIRELVVGGFAPGARVSFAAGSGRAEEWSVVPQSESLLLRSGAARVALRIERDGLKILAVRGPRDNLLLRSFEGLEFVPFYARAGLCFEADGWQHRFAGRERIRVGEREIDALVLKSEGRGIQRRIWFSAGIARVEGHDRQGDFSALRVNA